MAGNDSDARRQAERAYNDAKRAGASPDAQKQLKADFDAARSKELKAMGQNEQVGYGLNRR